MGEDRLYLDQITRDRYLKDLDAIRTELQDFMGIDRKIIEMENEIKQKQQDIENPSTIQRILILKKHIIIAIVGWIISDIAILLSFSNGGPALWAIAIACVELAWVVYVIKLWKNPGKVYEESAIYAQQMQELESMQNEVKREHIKKSKLEPIIVNQVSYIPQKYLYGELLLEFEKYMRYNGAETLVAAINMHEQQKSKF